MISVMSLSKVIFLVVNQVQCTWILNFICYFEGRILNSFIMENEASIMGKYS